MSIYEYTAIAFALALDTFAVSVVRGCAFGNKSARAKISEALRIGFAFGLFQAGMPLIGFYVGGAFLSLIAAYDHWVAFALLAWIGASMIISSRKEDKSEETSELTFKTLIALAIATSIDALAIGVSFAAIDGIALLIPILVIGLFAFFMSMIGFFAGGKVSGSFNKAAELIGGIVLILLGVKVLLEHYGVIAF